MSHPSQFGPANQPSGGGGSSLLWILLTVALVLLLLCGGLCAGCVVMARRTGEAFKESFEEGLRQLQIAAALQATEEAVRNDPQVKERLGEPIETITQPQRFEPGKELNRAGETLQFDVKGPEGTGIASAVAVAEGEGWRVTKITVTFEDGSVVDVPPPEGVLTINDLNADEPFGIESIPPEPPMPPEPPAPTVEP